MIAAYTTKQSPKDIAKYLELAKRRLHSAEILLKAGEYKDAASRTYYGFFDAASALLLTKGLVAKTHSGLIALFNIHFVKTGKIKSQFATLFKRAKEAREEADYEIYKEFSKENVENILKTAKDFIKEIERVIKKTKKVGK